MAPTLATKLARFMKANGIKPLALAAEAGISRQQLYRIRAGTADLRIMTAMRIRDACGRLLTRRVSIDELFDADDPQAQRRSAKPVPS